MEGELIPLQADESVVGDGDPVGICAQVLDDVLWAAERGLVRECEDDVEVRDRNWQVGQCLFLQEW